MSILENICKITLILLWFESTYFNQEKKLQKCFILKRGCLLVNIDTIIIVLNTN